MSVPFDLPTLRRHRAPRISIVIPVHNEAPNIVALLDEIVTVLCDLTAFEIVVVDDASHDQTTEVLAAARARTPELRVLRHTRNAGQSAAIRSGVKAARAPWIVTLDGDGQNDPADIPRLLDMRQGAPAWVRMIAGKRVVRRDGIAKRWASRIANRVRSAILSDHTPDTGCGLKLFEREMFLDLPYFDHMHRYLPALTRRAGWEVMHVAVGHRPRLAGVSKYGTWDRFWVGLADLRGVLWLIRRHRPTGVEEMAWTSTSTTDTGHDAMEPLRAARRNAPA